MLYPPTHTLKAGAVPPPHTLKAGAVRPPHTLKAGAVPPPTPSNRVLYPPPTHPQSGCCTPPTPSKRVLYPPHTPSKRVLYPPPTPSKRVLYPPHPQSGCCTPPPPPPPCECGCQSRPNRVFPRPNTLQPFCNRPHGHCTRFPAARGQPAPPPCVTFRLVVVPLRGAGQSPVLPFACCVRSLPPHPPHSTGPALHLNAPKFGQHRLGPKRKSLINECFGLGHTKPVFWASVCLRPKQ